MTFKRKTKIPPHEILRTCVGTGLGIGGVALLADLTDIPLIIAPFGASAVLLYSATSSPLAQPKNLILGHIISGFVAISCCNLLGNTLFSTVLAVMIAIVCMMVFDAVHPPGGATALLCMLQDTTSYIFLATPLIAGVLILLFAAVIASKIVPKATAYPVRKQIK
jgi:CBS-domain-containing membrane protein